MTSGLSWRDRMLELRNRLLASPRFQRWATRFPPSRWIARRRARRTFDLCAGFVYSQVLWTCVRLDLFRRLAEGPRTADALAGPLGLTPEAAERLLRAAASLGLVDRRGHARFGLGGLGAVVLGSPAITAMIEHHALLYRDLADPIGLLRGERSQTALSTYWPYAGSTQPQSLTSADVEAYSTLMAESQPLVADPILAAHPLGAHRCLLDVGGGDGSFLMEAARRTPGLRGILFDLPAVAERAGKRFAEAGLGERLTAVGGDFFAGPLPPGADVVSLVRVVHDHDDARALALLRAVRGVLSPGGVLLLAEPMAEAAGAEPVGDAYFGFYLLAMGSGRARTAAELEALLGEAGFVAIRRLPTPMPLQTGLLRARRPAV